MKFKVISIMLILLSFGIMNLNLQAIPRHIDIDQNSTLPGDIQIWYWYDGYGTHKAASEANANLMKSKIETMGYAINLTNHDANLEVLHNNGSIGMDLIIVDPQVTIFSSTYLSFDAINQSIPILAMGYTALDLFTDFSLDTTTAGSCGNLGAIDLFNSTHPIITTPNQLNTTITVYNDNTIWECFFSPNADDPGDGVEFFGGSTVDNTRVPISFEDDRYFFWGYDAIDKWSSAGDKLFHNILNFLIGPGINYVEPVESSTSVSSSSTTSSASTTSSVTSVDSSVSEDISSSTPSTTINSTTNQSTNDSTPILLVFAIIALPIVPYIRRKFK